MTTRRELIVVSGAIALFSPLALAQKPANVRRIAVLTMSVPIDIASHYTYGAFVGAMRQLGYVEGKNLVIEWRFAEGKADRLPELAADLIRSNVEVIVSTSTPVTHALQRATTSVPIVMTTIGDPVGSGFIKSLRQPGGNITGMTNALVDLSVKHLELLRSATPKLTLMGMLIHPDNASNIETFKRIQPVARKIGVRALAFEARTAREIEEAFGVMKRESVQAVILAQDGLFIRQRRQIADLALQHQVPSIGATQEFADAGLLISYGPNFPDIYQRAATYVDKILRGANPADLPVEQPMRFDFVTNLKTAKALGISLPDEILVRTDRFIE